MEMRLIDANNINVEDTIGGRNEFADCIRDSVDCVLGNAPTVFIIPENPTNGDMVKALFGKDISNECIDYLCKIRKCGEWWNAPYKAESEVKMPKRIKASDIKPDDEWMKENEWDEIYKAESEDKE